VGLKNTKIGRWIKLKDKIVTGIINERFLLNNSKKAKHSLSFFTCLFILNLLNYLNAVHYLWKLSTFGFN
jgi:hypothetical protein